MENTLLTESCKAKILLYNGQNIQWTLSLSRTRKGPRDLFEIEIVRDREKLVNLRKTE